MIVDMKDRTMIHPRHNASASAARAARTLAAALALSMCALMCLPASAQAAGLECPEIGPGAAPDLVSGDRFSTGNAVELASEINGVISRLRADKPDVSNDEIVNALLASYCPVVARMAQASPAEKWRLMHRFDSMVMQQLSANTMPPGSLIIASVPLAPDLFSQLSAQAEAAGQTPAQYMAAVLAKAVKQ